MQHSSIRLLLLTLAWSLPALVHAAPPPCGGSCAVGTEYCDTSTDTCTTCTACNTGEFEEVACGGGDGNTDRLCSSCPDGCIDCNDATTCNTCGPDSWFFPAPVFGSPACVACTTCQPNETEIVSCDFGHDRQCMATTVGCADPNCATCSGSGPSQCTTCASGFYLASGDCVACTSCAAGTYVLTACSASADATCSACTPGTYSDEPDATGCTACDAGTFQASSSATGCEPCAAGKTSEAGQNQCSCPAGTVDDAGSCVACPAGKYASGGSCVDCPAGTSSQEGASACTACAAGTYASIAGSSACSSCGDFEASSQYNVSTTSGATECTPCSGNEYANPDFTACLACPSGQYWTGYRCDALHEGGRSTCSTTGATTPALAWFALPLAFAAFAWRRRRGA